MASTQNVVDGGSIFRLTIDIFVSIYLVCPFIKMWVNALWCFSEPEVSSLLKYSTDEEHMTVLDLSYSRIFH